MSLKGWVTAVVSEPIGTVLVADAAVGATQLSVDYAGDFDPDGGFLSLGGQTLAYTGFDAGEEDEDPDVIYLSGTTVAAATIDDAVQVLVGGLVATDMVAHVSLGDGDAVQVPVPFEQRALWALGSYEPPTPCTVADDLTRIEGVSGVQPVIQFGASLGFHVDTITALAPGELTIPLTYEPIPGSEDVKWNGLGQPGQWSRSGQTLTFPDVEELLAAGDRVTVEYAYLLGQAPPGSERTALLPDVTGTSSLYVDGSGNVAWDAPGAIGDLLVWVLVVANIHVPDVVAPGWALVGQGPPLGEDIKDYQIMVFTKEHDGSEPAVTAGTPLYARAFGTIIALDAGSTASASFDMAGPVGTGTTPAGPSTLRVWVMSATSHGGDIVPTQGVTVFDDNDASTPATETDMTITRDGSTAAVSAIGTTPGTISAWLTATVAVYA